MSFAHLARQAVVGLLGQIPIMGPVILEILRGLKQEATERRIIELIRGLAEGRSRPESLDTSLLFALLQADSEIAKHLQTSATPRNRYLYLAARNYASLERTYTYANDYGFLWRSYYNILNRPISNVSGIEHGDVIALGYRSAPHRFKVLLPVVVTRSSRYTLQIEGHGHDLRPFVRANDELSTLLRTDYDPDPQLELFTGLAVKPLYAELRTAKAMAAITGEYTSPGTNAIWRYDYRSDKAEVPAAVRDWIRSL